MIRLEGLTLKAGSFSLKDISLDIKEGDYFMLVGPTGSGKTVLLESIAGLRQLEKGSIRIGEKIITDLAAEKRGVSLVYQDCALFPHLSVKENIEFGLKIRKMDPARIRAELAQITGILGIQDLLSRKPLTLSGGERHKVALARSLAVKPDLLLLDEPLSALDPESREGLQQELKRLHSRLGITVIHVTHDFEEAMILGRHMAVIEQGHIRQSGIPESVFRQPVTLSVARFTQMRNLFSGSIIARTDEGCIFCTGQLNLEAVGKKFGASFAGIRPEEISISTDPPAKNTRNCYSGRVTKIIDKGSMFQVLVNVPPEFCCSITRKEFKEKGIQEGQAVHIAFSTGAVQLFE